MGSQRRFDPGPGCRTAEVRRILSPVSTPKVDRAIGIHVLPQARKGASAFFGNWDSVSLGAAIYLG